MIRTVGTSLICHTAYWDAYYSDEYDNLPESKKATYDLEKTQRDQRENLISYYAKKIEIIQSTTTQALEKCLRFSTISNHLPNGVHEVANKISGHNDINGALISAGNIFAEMWPRTRMIVMLNRNSYVEHWDNFDQCGLKTVKSEKISDNKIYRLIVLAIDPEGYIPVQQLWDKSLNLYPVLSRYQAYKDDENLHHYAQDDGTLGKLPYAYFAYADDQISGNFKIGFTTGFNVCWNHYRYNHTLCTSVLVVPYTNNLSLLSQEGAFRPKQETRVDNMY